MKKIFVIFLLFFFTHVFLKAQITITIQLNSESGKDALLHGLKSEANKSHGKTQQISANAWTFQGIPGVVRSIFCFNIKWIPKNVKVMNAYLTLYSWDSDEGMGKHDALSGSNDCWLERVISDWNENTVTWNTQPKTTEQNRVGFKIPQKEDVNSVTIDVTSLVQDMINDRRKSFGFMIKLQNEKYYRRVNFFSSDYSEPTKRPKLVISCTIP